MYLHPTQVTSVRTSTATGQWLDIQKAAMQGGEIGNNPLFQGSLGMYNNVIIRESEQVPRGVNSATGAAITTVRRAVFLGAQSCGICFGQNSGENKYRWNEELYDHKRRLEVSAWSIWGIKKFVWNSVDFAVITVPSYAADAV
jgi:N4-gp56 family major capsid protein